MKEDLERESLLKNAGAFLHKSIQPALPGVLPPCIEKLFLLIGFPVTGLNTVIAFG